jgi:hypothetical protein
VRKTLMLSLVLAFGAACAAAQTYPSSSPDSRTPQTATQPSQTSSADTTSIQGCVSGSDGNYTLTDNSGATYKLAGDTAKLTEHVGHKVEITGSTMSSSSSDTSAASASPESHKPAGAGAQHTLSVTSVKHISSTCSASR